MTIEAGGSVLVADSAMGELYRIEPGKPPLPLTRGALEVPTGVVQMDDDHLLVCDQRLGQVVRVPRTGGAVVEVAKVPAPRGLTVTETGEVVVLSMGPKQLVRVDPQGRMTPVVQGAPFRFPNAVIPARDGPGYLVSDGYKATIWLVSPSGETSPLLQGAPLVRPEGLAFAPDGALLIADPGARQVWRVPPGASPEPLFGEAH